MDDEATLTKAVRLQRRSYALLRSLTEPLDVGVLAMGFDFEHGSISFEDAAYEWLGRNIESFAPGGSERDDLRPLANLFASYLETSFDLIETPEMRRVSERGCSCPCCSYLAAAPHLRPKKLASIDKHRARLLEAAYLGSVAERRGVALTDVERDAILARPEMREPLAMATYAHELVRRMNGEPTGPEVLVLWRWFAWTPTGAPKRDFRLEATMLIEAQAAVEQAAVAVL